jgi:TolA protein
MSYLKEHRRGIIGTVLFHAGLILLLLFLGFVTPLPLPPEEGILVDFGNSATGSGRQEPSRKKAPAKKAPKVVTPKPKPKPPTPKPQPKPKPAPKKTSVETGQKDLLTQDFEKTVAVDAGAEKRKAEEEKKKRDQEIALQKQREEAKKKQDEIDRKKAEELERIRKEEEERIRIAEEARKKREAEEAKINEINSRAANAFGGGKTDNNSESKGQGVTYGANNQGSTNGTPGANQYGTGGGAGNGISFSLTGRSAKSLPKPGFPGNEGGRVVVEVTVDKYGKVTNANPGAKGSTTMDPGLLNAARKVALSARFNTDDSAPAFQRGTITYNFVLD